MKSIELLKNLKMMGFHLTIVEIETGIKYQRLHRCINGISELKETDYLTLKDYYENKVTEKGFNDCDKEIKENGLSKAMTRDELTDSTTYMMGWHKCINGYVSKSKDIK